MKKSFPVSDEDLWLSASSGDADAEEELVKRYAGLVRMCARPYFLAGGDSEDLIQEGLLGLLSAIRRYDPKMDTQFKTYAELCIKNRLYTAIKSASRFKHAPLNNSVSLESSQFGDSYNAMSCYLRDPEELVITRELTDEISLNLGDSLSKLEKEILGFYLEGLSYQDIAQKTGRSVKSVDNAVQRIKRKLSRFL